MSFSSTIFKGTLSNIYNFISDIRERDKNFSRCVLIFKSEEKMNEFLASYNKIFCDEKG
jgi:hypothetical protein